MSPLARGRAWLADPRPLPVRRGLLLAAAVLLLLSLGTRWRRGGVLGVGVTLYTPMFKIVAPTDLEAATVTSPGASIALVPDWTRSMLTVLPVARRGVAGTGHPARVPIAASGVIGLLAFRRRSRRLMAAALTVAAVGLVLTSGGSLMSPGWILLAAATAAAAAGGGLVSAPAGRRR